MWVNNAEGLKTILSGDPDNVFPKNKETYDIVSTLTGFGKA